MRCSIPCCQTIMILYGGPKNFSWGVCHAVWIIILRYERSIFSVAYSSEIHFAELRKSIHEDWSLTLSLTFLMRVNCFMESPLHCWVFGYSMCNFYSCILAKSDCFFHNSGNSVLIRLHFLLFRYNNNLQYIDPLCSPSAVLMFFVSMHLCGVFLKETTLLSYLRPLLPVTCCAIICSVLFSGTNLIIDFLWFLIIFLSCSFWWIFIVDIRLIWALKQNNNELI